MPPLKVDTRYDNVILLRFLREKLPYTLRRAIDTKKYELYEIAKKIKSSPGVVPAAEKFFAVEDCIYSVKFALGKFRQDAPDDDPLQELLILQIEQVPGMHGIR